MPVPYYHQITEQKTYTIHMNFHSPTGHGGIASPVDCGQ